MSWEEKNFETFSQQPNTGNSQSETKQSVCVSSVFLFTYSTLTIVIGEGHDGGKVALAVLGDDTEAGEGAPFAGDVESRVPAVVCQPRVTASLQELLHQQGLLCDHC